MSEHTIMAPQFLRHLREPIDTGCGRPDFDSHDDAHLSRNPDIGC